MKSLEEQIELIRRGVDRIVPEEELKQKLEKSLKTGKPLRVKYGIDPTGIDVHLGHTVPLRKLRLFQELGHQAVLIIGNYTAMVGDPSGRDKAREGMTEEQVEANARDYLTQVAKVIDIEKAEVRRNGEWFGKFNFLDVLRLMSQITMQRMLERDDFDKRIKAAEGIRLSECLYPLMQGHDSVEIHADVELGGSEQLFNLMVARDLQKDAGQSQQVCITLPLLRGLDGEKKMGKSLKNYIGVNESATDMVIKTMRIPDHLMTEWFELLTDRTTEEIKNFTNADEINPRDAKMQLGKDIASFYYGEEDAEAGVQDWINIVQKGSDPTEIPEVELPSSELENGEIWICKLLVLLGLAGSNGEARRAISGSAVKLGEDREKVTDAKANIAVTDGLIVRNGKQKVARVKLS
ncbi:MAG: tyrosine--tRNA ligase [Gemmataceae bacterium]